MRAARLGRVDGTGSRIVCVWQRWAAPKEQAASQVTLGYDSPRQLDKEPVRSSAATHGRADRTAARGQVRLRWADEIGGPHCLRAATLDRADGTRGPPGRARPRYVAPTGREARPVARGQAGTRRRDGVPHCLRVQRWAAPTGRVANQVTLGHYRQRRRNMGASPIEPRRSAPTGHCTHPAAHVHAGTHRQEAGPLRSRAATLGRSDGTAAPPVKRGHAGLR